MRTGWEAGALSIPLRLVPRDDRIAGLALVSPPLAYAVALLAVPLIAVVAFSFWTQNYLEIDRTLTLANYAEAWTEPLYRLLMGRSLAISAVTTAVNRRRAPAPPTASSSP